MAITSASKPHICWKKKKIDRFCSPKYHVVTSFFKTYFKTSFKTTLPLHFLIKVPKWD